uniref:Uncharacterized protein n=1 Tax=Sander lucioperca TaxID=283035 RepID=A0A8C9YME8_SANLU
KPCSKCKNTKELRSPRIYEVLILTLTDNTNRTKSIYLISFQEERWKLPTCILNTLILLHVEVVCKTSSSKACPPVLMTLWITFATWPLRRELSSLTRSSRQVQRTAREPARRIRPTVRSDSPVDTNKCLPAE